MSENDLQKYTFKKKIQSYNGGMKIWIFDIFVGNIMTVAMLSIKTKESRINES